MTKNITISVPDKLGAKVEKWRERMNISKVCQKALEREVAQLEDFPKFGKDLEGTVERLRTEKETSYRVGLEVGVEYAKNEANLAELRRFGRTWPTELTDLPSHCQKRFKELSSWYFGDDGASVEGKYKDLPLNEEEYAHGCGEGIRSVWEVLRDKV